MIFVDANIPMYAMGAPHPHKEPCIRWFLGVSQGRHEAVTDAEVLQEILYRYWRIAALSYGVSILDQFMTVVPTAFSVTRTDVERATALLQEIPLVEPRDALHAAVMLNRDIKTILSYDRHFDRVKGLRRIEP